MQKKFGTSILMLIMVMSLLLTVGCGKEENNNGNSGNNSDPKPSESIPNEDDESSKEPEKQPVRLLKRNGVEWKENTKINSQRGEQSYTVVWGDTLSLIARTWNVNCYRLARFNNIKDINKIEVGQVIYNYTYQGAN